MHIYEITLRELVFHSEAVEQWARQQTIESLPRRAVFMAIASAADDTFTVVLTRDQIGMAIGGLCPAGVRFHIRNLRGYGQLMDLSLNGNAGAQRGDYLYILDPFGHGKAAVGTSGTPRRRSEVVKDISVWEQPK